MLARAEGREKLSGEDKLLQVTASVCRFGHPEIGVDRGLHALRQCLSDLLRANRELCNVH